MNNKYNNGKVYKLENNVDDEIYIGSSYNTLSKRLYKHKNTAKVKPKKVHHHLNNIGWENVKITLIEAYPCNDKQQLLQRERYWIDIFQPSLNIVLPCRTKLEYGKEYSKKYRIEHADIVKESAKKWRENNQNKIKLMRDTNKQYHKSYTEAHKDKIQAQQKETTICDCGCKIRKYEMTRHIKTKKHQKWAQNQPSTSQI
jgi:group I intron endonuclease